MNTHVKESAPLYHPEEGNHLPPVQPGDVWCLFGTNRSGIEDVIQGLTHQAEGNCQVLSFASQQEIFEEELRKDDSNFQDRIDPGTPAAAFVTSHEEYKEIITAFNLEHCMQKGYRQLSSGESRKLLLLAAISQKPRLLIIESPYDGVDRNGCLELDRVLGFLCQQGYTIVVTVSNISDIPPWCDNIALIHKGSTAIHGSRSEMLTLLRDWIRRESGLSLNLENENTISIELPSELIHLTDGFARYGETPVFSGVNLTIKPGVHTLITGPNGCGKSTLLHILSGDNQNCYANNLQIMGIKRGSGESIWQLKRHMGIVTPELHRNHYIPGSALQVVLSGFFDSIGVYCKFTPQQEKEAKRWLAMTGLADRATSPFRKLTYAEQRLCLIARALIKLPPLLLLDEPTQGLDQQSREDLLDFLELIAEKKLCTIVYASHREDEFRSFFRQHLDLYPFSQRKVMDS